VKKYSLLGWSDGGITALIMAAGYPDRVQNLVIWGACSFVTQEDIDGCEKVRDIAKWSDEMRKPFIEVYGEEYFRTQFSLRVDAVSLYLNEFNGNLCFSTLVKFWKVKSRAEYESSCIKGHLLAESRLLGFSLLLWSHFS